MSDNESDRGDGVVEISSESESERRQNDDDDLFVLGSGPSQDDIKELDKPEPVLKKGNEPKTLKPATNEQCSICLQPFDVVTVLSGCYHRFCFACILHWSQVSSTCPLCKRALGYLMYDITADGQYRTFYPKDLHSSAPSRSKLLEKFPTEAHRRRKTVYTTKLQRLPVPRKRVAPSLPSASSAAPQSLINERSWEQRIEPWVRRELQALLSDEDVDLILLLTRGLVLKHGPTSPQFVNKLREFLFEHTDTFSSELDAFICSGLEMGVYDRLVEYRSPSSPAASTGKKRRQSDEDK